MKRVRGFVGIPGILTRVGLKLNKDLTYDVWAEVGQTLRDFHRCSLWWLGDWLNYGERKYGETYSQAIDETEYDYQTLANCAWICTAIEFSRRRETLSFSSHADVAAMKPEDQDRWLDRAEQKGWGHKELRAAIREERQEKAALEAGPLPPGKYPVIYADPPWSYSNSGFLQSAESKYPTLDLEKIEELRDIDGRKVQDLTIEESVLFLWATAPLTPDNLRVMDAWGFSYKTHFIWPKGRGPGIGWFLETRHELLLIGTQKTNVHPAVKPSSIIEAPAGAHSEKPDAVYEIIESMYAGPYVELFARRAREGWDSWGHL